MLGYNYFSQDNGYSEEAYTNKRYKSKQPPFERQKLNSLSRYLTHIKRMSCMASIIVGKLNIICGQSYVNPFKRGR